MLARTCRDCWSKLWKLCSTSCVINRSSAWVWGKCSLSCYVSFHNSSMLRFNSITLHRESWITTMIPDCGTHSSLLKTSVWAGTSSELEHRFAGFKLSQQFNQLKVSWFDVWLDLNLGCGVLPVDIFVDGSWTAKFYPAMKQHSWTSLGSSTQPYIIRYMAISYGTNT